ncbi:YlzJ-like family protein [Neobacillus mesonae]|uniref:Ribonuclease n=1 Tax=Neobacillus mesonae TaxID=1193713 RepID=A0A3Q9QT26_9BACI|nr:YlzJ-like family protein [Neobacillus mesonae]AZU61542.1 ribonuclease [Neobacillus mesonae]MED4202562.1 YlzJ-like family protein [Neobacillus mesonae]
MILYTMMPHDLVFPPEMDSFEKQQMVNFQGIPLLVEQVDTQNVQVIRNLSSDPQHYMDGRVCPGAKISFASLDGEVSY